MLEALHDNISCKDHSLHYRTELKKLQQDAAVCKYLFTAKLLYMIWAYIAPIIGREYMKWQLQPLVQIIL